MVLTKLAERAKLLTDASLRDLLKYCQKPNIISFSLGIPNPKLFPIKDIKKILNKLLKDKTGHIFQYNQTQGYPQLLEQIAKYYSKKWKRKIKPENVLITTGSQQGLDLLAKTFVNKKDTIMVENPTYFVALSAFNAYQPNYTTINTQSDGIDIDKLKKKLKQKTLKKLKLLYLIPTYQNPSGICLSLKKRKQLAQLAKKLNLAIVEDDPYGDLCYGNKYYSPIYAYAPKQVIYMSSFSKTLAPGLRVGLIVAHKNIIERLTLIKQGMDVHTPTLSQAIIAQFLKDKKLYQNQLKKTRRFYSQHKKAMIKALEKYSPPGVSWTNPKGGLFLWLRLPKKINIKKLFFKSIENNVSFTPGFVFYAKKKNYHTLRLCYAMVNKKQIEKGIKILTTLIKKSLKT